MKIQNRYKVIFAFAILAISGFMLTINLIQAEVNQLQSDSIITDVLVAVYTTVKGLGLYLLCLTGISVIGVIISAFLKNTELKKGFQITTLISIIALLCFMGYLYLG